MEDNTRKYLLNSIGVLGGSAALFGLSYLMPESKETIKEIMNYSGLTGLLVSAPITAGLGLKGGVETLLGRNSIRQIDRN